MYFILLVVKVCRCVLSRTANVKHITKMTFNSKQNNTFNAIYNKNTKTYISYNLTLFALKHFISFQIFTTKNKPSKL